jgi:hypothetical protein
MEELIELELVDQEELDRAIGEFIEVLRPHSPEPNGPFAEQDFDEPVFPLPDNFDYELLELFKAAGGDIFLEDVTKNTNILLARKKPTAKLLNSLH